MNWRQMSHAKRKSIVSELCNKGMNQQEVADELLCNVSTVKRFCRDYDIGIWPRGGQRGNTNAMITGASHQSIRKKTQEIVIKVGKNLRVCERCNDYNKWQNWSIHHKDEDR